MDQYLKTRVEIETLHGLLPDLDYYRILKMPPEAPQSEVDVAFRRESRRLHPDRFSRMDGPIKEQINVIYRVINEAYRTLKDPDARARYDIELASGANRMSAEASAVAAHDAAAQQNPENAARTPKGEKYWKMGLKCLADKDYRGAVMQIQFALTFEPENEIFRDYLEKSKTTADQNQREKGNPFKLRIL